MLFMLIQIKFNININDDELFKTIYDEYKKKEKKIWLSLVVHSNVDSNSNLLYLLYIYI
jgi:hypothetical protein